MTPTSACTWSKLTWGQKCERDGT